TASYLAALNAGDKVSLSADRLLRSGAAMKALLDDLVDFNRTKLGLGVNVAPSDIDLSAVVNDELEQFRGAHPERQIELATSGDCRGRWDGARLQQLVRNLVANAIRYGSPETAIRVELRGGPDELHIEVTNSGSTIGPTTVAEIFDPLKRAAARSDDGDPRAGLGLGLFIVREIATAHGGTVEVRSGDGETTFAVSL